MAGLNRKERDLLLRKTDILKASERIFALKGYDKATIKDIARRAQYAPGTVYLYFKGKDSLYFSLFEAKMKELLFVIKERVASVADAKEKLEIFLEEELKFFKENQDFLQVFISVNNGPKVSIDYKISKLDVTLEYLDLTCVLVKMAQQQGITRKDLSSNQVAGI